MSYGMTVYDASGVKIFDMTDRLIRFFSTINYSGVSTAIQTIAVPGMTTDGSWLVYLTYQYHVVTINIDSFTIRQSLYTPVSDSGTAYVFRV